MLIEKTSKKYISNQLIDLQDFYNSTKGEGYKDINKNTLCRVLLLMSIDYLRSVNETKQRRLIINGLRRLRQ